MEKPLLSPIRLEAFSDGVIAIIITIMVLELKVPREETLHALSKLWPVFLSYILSFLMVAIYWINHHHLFHQVKRVDARILWANMILLFFLSLVPFFTAYMGETGMGRLAVTLYSTCLLLCAMSFWLLRVAIHLHNHDDANHMDIYRAAGKKNLTAAGMYLTAIAFAYISPAVSLLLIFGVALMYASPTAGIYDRIRNK